MYYLGLIYMRKNLKNFLTTCLILCSSTVLAEKVNSLACYSGKKNFEKSDTLEMSSDFSTIVQDDYLLRGDVDLKSSEFLLNAQEVRINKFTKFLSAINADFNLANNYRGSANKIEINSDKINIENGFLTFCPPGKNTWGLTSDNLILSRKNNLASTQNMTLSIFDIPILYLPSLDFYTSGKGSGFLAPTFKSNKESSVTGNSYQVKIPYFYNIANDKDILLTLNSISNRGNVLEGKYRQLLYDDSYIRNGDMSLTLKYLDNDNLLNDRRWLFKSQGNYKTDKAEITFDLNRVSDNLFHKQIELEGNSEERLISKIQTKMNFNGLDMSVSSEDEQLINDGTSDYTKPFAFDLSKKFNGSLNTNFGINYSKFAHNDSSKKTGKRTIIDSSINKKLEYKNLSLKPELRFHNTNYSLDNSENHNRFIYDFSLEGYTNFSKQYSLFNDKLLNTFSPKFSYEYIPVKNQSNLPNFDTQINSSILIDIFKDSPFIGEDKISNKNSLIFGFENFIHDSDGDEILNFGLSKQLNLKNTKTKLDGSQEPIASNGPINLYLNIARNNYGFKTAISFNPHIKTTEKSHSTLFWKNNKTIFELSYINDTEETISSSFNLPVKNNLQFFGSLNHLLSGSIDNRKSLGLTYDSCCISGRVFLLDKNVGNSNYDREINFEVVFKGLGSTSPDLIERIQKEIPKYDLKI